MADQNQRNEGRYWVEIMKCVGSDVVVTYAKGDKVATLKGRCVGISKMHLSIVVMTKTEKKIIKHIIEISRKRTMTR